MSAWGIIIAIVYVIAHIVSAIAKESAKRKEEQRKRDEAARIRRGETEVAGASGDSPINLDPMLSTSRGSGQPTPPTIPSGRKPSAKDDLAARRREQIEQLRNRRQVKQGIPKPDSIQKPQPAPSRATRVLEPEILGDEARRRQEIDDAKTRRNKQFRAQQQEAGIQARKDREKRERAFREATTESTAAKTAAATREQAAIQRANDPAAVARARQIEVRNTLKARLRQPASVREILILKEVLDQPLAMRGISAG